MKVLLYGKGWLGTIFANMCSERGHNIVYGGRVENIKDVEKEIVSVEPDRVVSMIGRTHGTGYKTIDYLEQKGKLVENINDNLYAPLILANVCKELGVHLTYLGTGCIFSYSEDKDIFYEEDLPNFFGSSYSTVKGFTDRLMHDIYNDTVLNVRIRMPIHSVPNSRNFIDKIVSYTKICSVPNSMTVIDDLFPLLVDMMESKRIGTINLCNKGTITHNDILNMYKDIIDPTHTWKNILYDEQMQFLSADRSNNELDSSSLDQLGVPDIFTSVKRCMDKYKEHLSQR